MRRLRRLAWLGWREQLPFLLLAVLLVPLHHLVIHVTLTAPDEYPLSEGLALGGPDEGTYLLGILAFAMGGSAWDPATLRTLATLDTLPLHRWQVLLSRMAVGICGLCAVLVADRLLDLALHLFTAPSLDPGWHLPLVLTAAAVRAVPTVTLYVIGVAAGVLRRLAWTVCGVALLLGYLLSDADPALRVLDAFWPARVVPTGVGLDVPWDAVGFWGAVTGATVLAAIPLYSRAGARVATALEGLQATRVGAVVQFGLGAGALGAWIVLLAVALDEEDEPQQQVVTAGGEAGSLRTARLRFGWRTDEAAADVEALAAQADALVAQVEEVLGPDPLPVVIRVDLDGTGPAEHLAGAASDGAIRLGEHDAATLCHEVTHVILEHRSQGRIRDLGGYGVLLHEGIAGWMEARCIEDADAIRRADLLTASLLRSQPLRFEELASAPSLDRRHGPELKYEVGLSLVQALVRYAGDDALERLLDALARPGIRTALTPLETLEDALQACDVDLDRLADAWYTHLRATRDAHWDGRLDAAWSPVRAAVERSGDALRVTLDPPCGATDDDLSCGVRVRAGERTPDGQLDRAKVEDDAFRVDVPADATSTFELQVLLRVTHDGREIVVPQAWVRRPLPSRP